jgi:hypothetical protein
MRSMFPTGEQGAQAFAAAMAAWRTAKGSVSPGDPVRDLPVTDMPKPSGAYAGVVPDQLKGRKPPTATFGQGEGQTSGTSTGTMSKPAQRTPAEAAGITPDAKPDAKGTPWWKNPQDDYTPDGGPGWNGSGDVQADHPDWWGEIKNFAPEHQMAMRNAYHANDEAAFQAIRDTARAELYGGQQRTGNGAGRTPPTTTAPPASNPTNSVGPFTGPDVSNSTDNQDTAHYDNAWAGTFKKKKRTSSTY